MAFNGRFVLNIAHYAAKFGADFQSLIAISGKTEEELNQQDSKVPTAIYNKIIDQAIQQTKDPFFGLHIGESQNLSAIGLILQISQASSTVKEALEYCCQFANLGCSSLPMSLVEKRDHFEVRMTPIEQWVTTAPMAFQHTALGVLVFALREFHTLTRIKHQAIAIHLSWPQPDDISEYKRIFACPIYFGRETISILLRKEHVNAEVITADHMLLAILVQYAEEKSAQLRVEHSFLNTVKESVVNLVEPSFPSIEEVAKHLNLSLRTLQRRLKAEDYTYKKLIDELRQEFALSYLRRPDLSVTEIAFLLDYADTSAFSRSFKRWQGCSPNAYRQQLSTT